MDRSEILETFPLAVALIKAEEGFRAAPYPCYKGKLTIGYGYNLEAHGYTREEVGGMRWGREKAEEMLIEELVDIVAALNARYPLWRELLNEAREAVVLSAVYQLGIGGAAAFKNTIAKIRTRDWEGAAQNMLASKWARQTPARVQRNANIMRTGVMPQEVNGVQIVHRDPHISPDSDEPAAPTEPAAHPLPPVGPGHEQVESKPVVPEVGEAVPLGRAVLTSPAPPQTPPALALVKHIFTLVGKSPATYGAGGMLAMLVGNVRIKLDLWFFDSMYHFEDGSLVAAFVAVGVVFWGVTRQAVRASSKQ